MTATTPPRRRPFPAALSSVLVAVLFVFSNGCATTATGSTADTRDVEELKRRVLELQQQARKSELEIDRLRQKVAVLEARAGLETPAPGTEDPAEARSEPDPEPPSPGVRTEPQRPEPVDGPLLEEIDLDEPEPTPPPARRPVAPTPAPSAPADRSLTEDAQALYDEGYSLFHRQRYLDAEATFQRFLRTWAGTSLADNAQYWIGESRFARGDLRGALAAFRETVERYPEGNKVPDALFKAGQTLEALGDVEGARETYREVIRRFPAGPTAGKAEERLEQLP